MDMAMMLRTPSFLPLSCRSTRFRARSPRYAIVCSTAQTDPTRLFVSPIGHTLLAFSRIVARTQSLAQAMENALREASARPSTREEALIQGLRNNLSIAGAIGCFASVSTGSVNTPLTVVASGMAKWLELYSGVLMLRVLLSWFPNIPWERQPLQAIRDMCDPYLNLFRNIIPPLFNALDVSPLLAFLVLGVLTSTLNTALQA